MLAKMLATADRSGPVERSGGQWRQVGLATGNSVEGPYFTELDWQAAPASAGETWCGLSCRSWWSRNSIHKRGREGHSPAAVEVRMRELGMKRPGELADKAGGSFSEVRYFGMHPHGRETSSACRWLLTCW